MAKKEITKIISNLGGDRLRLRVEIEKGKVVKMVVQYEAKFEAEWYVVVKYDCFHETIAKPPLSKSAERWYWGQAQI